MDLEKMAQNHGIELKNTESDNFDNVIVEPEPDESAIEKEKNIRDFQEAPDDNDVTNAQPDIVAKDEPKEDPKKDTEDKGETDGYQNPESDDVLKRWEGKEKKDIAKAHYEAEKWGKQKANEANELRRMIEQLQSQPAEPQQPTTPQQNEIEAVRSKYGDEAVDMIMNIAGLATKPLTDEMEREKYRREESRIKEFETYHKSYQEKNPDYAEKIDSVRNISTNIAGLLSEYMESSGCTKKQVKDAVRCFNFDRRVPAIAHTILKGENLETYAKKLSDVKLQKEIDVNNAKAEFGGGAPVSSEKTNTPPKFNTIDEEIEWRRQNDPAYRGMRMASL